MARSAKKRRGRRDDLPVVNQRAAAIDVGARFHVVAVAPERDAEPVRTFRAFTNDLHRLADWLEQAGVITVATESTGVYWIPVFEILERAALSRRWSTPAMPRACHKGRPRSRLSSPPSPTGG